MIIERCWAVTKGGRRCCRTANGRFEGRWLCSQHAFKFGRNHEIKTVVFRPEPQESWSIPVTADGSLALQRLDRQLVGTVGYLGLAYFWSHQYKHSLRAVTPRQRKRIHDAWLVAGLDLAGVSDKHQDVLDRLVRR